MFSCRILSRPRGGYSSSIWQASHDCRCSSGLKRFSSMPYQIPLRAETGEAYTAEGRNLLAKLMEHNIGLHAELRAVRKLRWKRISVVMAGRHALQWSDLNYFTNKGFSYVEAVCRRYVADNVKPLWWRTQAVASSARPVVFRNKATARMNVAFRQALHNAGYDTQGRRLPNRQNEPGSSDKAIAHLFGTVVITTHEPAEVHKVPFKDLRDYCESVVQAIEQDLGQIPGDPGRRTLEVQRLQDPGRSNGGSRGGGGGKRGRGGQANKAGHRPRR